MRLFNFSIHVDRAKQLTRVCRMTGQSKAEYIRRALYNALDADLKKIGESREHGDSEKTNQTDRS